MMRPVGLEEMESEITPTINVISYKETKISPDKVYDVLCVYFFSSYSSQSR
jgi:hypothetical protein